MQLLEAVDAPTAPAGLATLPAIAILRQLWGYPYWQDNGKGRFREAQDLPPAGMRMDSPDDSEAHCGHKRRLTWTEYKAPLTASCDETGPHLLPHGTTTAAGGTDVTQTARLHHALEQQQLLSPAHLADAGDVDAALIVQSATRSGIELIGPVRPDVRWQAHTPEAFAMTQCAVAWEQESVPCPPGNMRSAWTPDQAPWGKHLRRVQCAHRDGICCTPRVWCPKAKTTPRCLRVR